MSTQPAYGPVGENYQRFATFLACKIITSPTQQLQQRLANEVGEKIAAQFYPQLLVWKGVRDGAWGYGNGLEVCFNDKEIYSKQQDKKRGHYRLYTDVL